MLDREVIEAAAEWYANLREAEPDSPIHQEHNDWLNQAPEHRQAWRRVEKLQGKLRIAPPELIQPALKQARAARHRIIKLLSITLMMVGAVLVGWQQMGWQQMGWQHHWLADYSTETGEIRQVSLADGSVLILNTATAVDIDFTQQQRLILLRQGEIQITTAKDSRPLIVRTTQGEIEALGTRFLVQRQQGNTQVSVLEQAVELRIQSEQVIRVEAGYQAQFTKQQVSDVEPIQGHPAAWVSGQLIVSDWTLGRFLDELSRYHSGVLIYDESVADLRLSGAFYLKDTQAILDNLAVMLPIQVQQFTPYVTRVKSR